MHKCRVSDQALVSNIPEIIFTELVAIEATSRGSICVGAAGKK
jgi:hypothetical protein